MCWEKKEERVEWVFVAREEVNADAAVESVAEALAAEGKEEDLRDPNIPLPPSPPPPFVFVEDPAMSAS